MGAEGIVIGKEGIAMRAKRIAMGSEGVAMRAEGMIDMNAEGIRVAMDRHESKKDRLDS